ncbi:hypothetical protein Pla123a_11540 [Posidoniimonas polymericola]|uniref:PEP-CTERM protein-sorting domain-containing protein n=1 Tax=Posidoniimonas polymericola TaxID=2528002 RepID=A0A5C5YUM4_9BACT|nr:hypothetical protein [Posidoniimonas polymericola]TWT78363.1 hypothetical protein Pla123a_11540 [Posidoniimonas polymericola]
MHWLKTTRRLASILVIVAVGAADQATAAVFRYRQSGDWSAVTDGSSPGWGLNPNNDGVTPGPGLPGAGDDARINFGNNTVSVTTAVPAVNRVQIGVDESGVVEVNSGGVLTTVTDLLAGNNNSNATGSLVVMNGGAVEVGRILWAANGSSNGTIDVEAGGTITADSHFWWGVTGTATISISGTISQTGGILGLGTDNASTPTGGAATVDILDGGLLSLFNISSAAGLPSIQDGSSINIEGSGELTLPGDFVGVLTDYANANKIGAKGVLGMSNLAIDLTRNPGFTTAYAIPEPTGLLLASFAASVALGIRRI